VNCDKVQDLLSGAIDGSLSPVEATDFHAHLEACPPCRLLLAETKESLELLAELPAVEPRAGFEDGVWALVRAEHGAGAERPGARLGRRLRDLVGAGDWMRWVPLGAAAGMLVGIAVAPHPFGPAGSGVAALDAAREPRAAEAMPAPDEEFASAATSEAAAAEFAPVEYPAGMPEPVEVMIGVSGEGAQELRLNPDRYRRTNWQYPIRPVRDPLGSPVIPVSGGVVPDHALPAPAEAESGVPVLSF
jgi:anti-sigma factor RsiW